MNLAVATLPGPLLLFLAALAVALLSYLVHRWSTLSGLIAAAGCLSLGWISAQQFSESGIELLRLPFLPEKSLMLGRSFTVAGSQWALLPPGLAVITFLFFGAGLVFLLALPVSQGWAFYPLSTAVLAVLTLAVTSQHYLYVLLFVWLAATLTAFVLAGGIPRETTGALRYLVLTSLALMLLLVLPAFLSPESIEGDSAVALVMPPGYPQTGDRAMEAGLALQTAIVLLIVGFGILLMIVPFHGQLVALATYGAPMVAPFMILAFPPVVFYLLFRLGQTCPALFQDPLVFDVWRWMGIATVAVGGLSAVGQRQWGSLVGYAVLVDWGAGLVALGQGTLDGLEQATLMLGWRTLSLLLVGAGWTVVFKLSGKQENLEAYAGVLRRRPLSVLALVLGMLSLAAFPLTAGAAARWRLIADLQSARPGMAWVLILAGLGTGVGTAVALRACMTSSSIEGELGHPKDRPVEAILDTAFGLFALWLVGSLFLRSSLWVELVQRLFLSHFSFPPS